MTLSSEARLERKANKKKLKKVVSNKLNVKLSIIEVSAIESVLLAYLMMCQDSLMIGEPYPTLVKVQKYLQELKTDWENKQGKELVIS